MNKGNYKSPPVGTLLKCLFKVEDVNLFYDHEKLRRYFKEALEQENFSILEIRDHKISPVAYAALASLLESHASFDTYYEYNSIEFVLSSCRAYNPQEGKKAIKHLEDSLGIKCILEERYKKLVDPKEILK